MRRILVALSLLPGLLATPAFAGDAEVQAAQRTIDQQMQAFRAGDGGAAYSFAAPTIKQIFPSADIFMSMVTNGYPPVRNPKSYAFGKSQEMGPGKIAQQVMIVGPDGKDYEALYTLELQPDGVWRITGVSLKASNTLST